MYFSMRKRSKTNLGNNEASSSNSRSNDYTYNIIHTSQNYHPRSHTGFDVNLNDEGQTSSKWRPKLKVPKRFNTMNNKAARAMKAHDYETSIKYLNELVCTYPNSYQIVCDRSLAHFNLGDDQEALEDANSAISKKPDRSRAYYIRGRIYDRLGRPDETIRSFGNATTISPNDPEALEAHKTCARISYERGRYNDALQYLNNALNLDPTDTWVLYKRSQISFARKDYSRASADLNSLMFMNPNDNLRYDASELRGMVYKKLKQYDAALSDFNVALRIKSEDPLLIYKRARVYILQGRYAEALNDFEKIEKSSNINGARVLRNRGLAYKGLHRFKEALTEFTNALDIQEKSTTYRNRSQVYFALKQMDLSMADVNKALELDPQDIIAEELKNKIFSRIKQFDKALEGLNRTLNANPRNVDALAERGGVYLSMEKYDDALGDLNFAIKLQPQNIMALLTRAKVHRIREAYQPSLTDLNNAINVAPNDPRLYRNRGKVYTLLNQYNNSIADLCHSMSMEKEPHVSAFKYRGISYSKLGKYQDAISDFNNVLKMKPSNSIIYYNRGETYYKLSKLDLALEDLNKSLEYGEDLESLKLRSKILEEMGEFEKSRSDINRILASEPNNTTVLSKRAELNERLKQFQDCINDLSSVIKLVPQDVQVLKYRGRMLVKMCRYEEALKDFNKLLEVDGSDIEGIGLRAEVYQRLKRYEEALNDLKDGIDNKTGNKRWLLAVKGGILREQGKFEEALNDLNVAIDLPSVTAQGSNVAWPGTSNESPSLKMSESQQEAKVHAMALCYRGSIMRKSGKMDDALDDLNKALSIDPYNSLALCERSAILRDNDKYDEAWGDLEAVLNNYDDLEE